MTDINQALALRYQEPLSEENPIESSELLKTMIQRSSCRMFKEEPIDARLIRLLCGAALASPTKSDLQQRDIILVQDPQIKAKLIDLVGTETWVPSVPNIAVFCGNNKRQRLLHEMRGHTFVNDHLDAFFNASVDAAIALSAFVTAAEAMGLGCCPISAVRNKPEAVSELLQLPDFVFPVAGLAFG